MAQFSEVRIVHILTKDRSFYKNLTEHVKIYLSRCCQSAKLLIDTQWLYFTSHLQNSQNAVIFFEFFPFSCSFYIFILGLYLIVTSIFLEGGTNSITDSYYLIVLRFPPTELMMERLSDKPAKQLAHMTSFPRGKREKEQFLNRNLTDTIQLFCKMYSKVQTGMCWLTTAKERLNVSLSGLNLCHLP